MDKCHSRLMWITIALCTIKGSYQIKQQLQIKHLHVHYGDPVILKCLNNSDDTSWDGPSSQPSSLSTYIYNETPYAVDGKIRQQLPNAKNLVLVGNKSVGEFHLKIKNLTQNEEGFYKCNAHRGKQLFQFRFFLNGTEPPITLSTNAESGFLVGIAGDQMNITCRVRRELSDNETKIYLTMNRNDEFIRESANEVIIHSFVPESINNRDIFTCLVKSPLLNMPLTEIAILDIKYRPLIRFDRHEQNLTICEGTNFSLTCVAESNPVTTELFWKTNGKRIQREFEHNKNVSLNIVNIKRHHEGNYTCVAKNEIGNDKQTVYIRVLCCQLQTEMTHTSVIANISVIAAVSILLGTMIFLTKDKLKKKRKDTSHNDLENDEEDDIAVENQMNESRDDIADDGANPQSHSAVGEQDNRMESSGGSVCQGPVISQANNGLNYAEISFTPGQSGSRFVVHGKENMTIYSDVVLPLSSVAEHLDL